MNYDCKITRSYIYWKEDARETYNVTLDAESLLDAKIELKKIAWRLELSSGSKLVQDVLIKTDDGWLDILTDKIQEVVESE